MGIVGKHYWANAYGIDRERARDLQGLKEAVAKSVVLARARLLDLRAWRVGGEKGGVSVIALVEESHIAVHTWPGYDYATIDVYTCGEHTRPREAMTYLLSWLEAERFKWGRACRSQECPEQKLLSKKRDNGVIGRVVRVLSGWLGRSI